MPKGEYAEGTLLHRVLFESWERGRPPKRMHRAALRHVVRSSFAVAGEIINLFRDCDDDGRTREIPVWLDPQATPGSAYVMVGREIAGQTTIPLTADTILRSATKRRKRVVADGDLRVKKTKDGTYRVKGLAISLPDPGLSETV